MMVGEFESRKDMVQEATESVAVRVGRIATIITSAVRDVTREIGDMVTDGLEMREAARDARRDPSGRQGADPTRDSADGDDGA